VSCEGFEHLLTESNPSVYVSVLPQYKKGFKP